jgi:hypothetical protein
MALQLAATAASGRRAWRQLAHLLVLGLHVGEQGGQRHQVPLQVPALPQSLHGRNKVTTGQPKGGVAV